MLQRRGDGAGWGLMQHAQLALRAIEAPQGAAAGLSNGTRFWSANSLSTAWPRPQLSQRRQSRLNPWDVCKPSWHLQDDAAALHSHETAYEHEIS